MTAAPMFADEPPLLALVECSARVNTPLVIPPLRIAPRDAALELQLARKVSCMLIGDALTFGKWRLTCVQSSGLSVFYVLYLRDEPRNKAQAVSSDPAYRRQLYQRIGRRLVEFGWDASAALDKGGACWVSAWVTRARLRKLA
jgi:hypothetical protein